MVAVKRITLESANTKEIDEIMVSTFLILGFVQPPSKLTFAFAFAFTERGGVTEVAISPKCSSV
jgi:hypothetical protein